MRKGLLRLRDILEAIEKIEMFIFGTSFEDFQKDEMMKSAVVYNVVFAGEMANKAEDEFKDNLWEKIIWIGSDLTENYWKVDEKTVWKICKNDLPELKKQIQKIISENF